MFKSFSRKLLGSSVPGGTGSYVLQGWVLKYGEDRKRLIISVEFFYWLFNKIPTGGMCDH